MKTYFTCAALGFALMAGAPVVNAQSLVTSPYEMFVVQPSGTLLGPMPMVAAAGVLQPTQIVQTSLALLAAGSVASAETYPTRRVKIITREGIETNRRGGARGSFRASRARPLERAHDQHTERRRRSAVPDCSSPLRVRRADPMAAQS
jgi:hypothetical protein